MWSLALTASDLKPRKTKRNINPSEPLKPTYPYMMPQGANARSNAKRHTNAPVSPTISPHKQVTTLWMGLTEAAVIDTMSLGGIGLTWSCFYDSRPSVRYLFLVRETMSLLDRTDSAIFIPFVAETIAVFHHRAACVTVKMPHWRGRQQNVVFDRTNDHPFLSICSLISNSFHVDVNIGCYACFRWISCSPLNNFFTLSSILQF